MLVQLGAAIDQRGSLEISAWASWYGNPLELAQLLQSEGEKFPMAGKMVDFFESQFEQDWKQMEPSGKLLLYTSEQVCRNRVSLLLKS